MFFLFRKNKNKHLSINNHDLESQSVEATTQNSVETTQDLPAVNQRQFWSSGTSPSDWMAEVYEEQVRKGAFDNLPGKGKPLEIQSGDVLSSILKNANVLPDWLILQHEIKNHIGKLRSTLRESDKDKIDREIADINKKIKRYNTLVPNSILQKEKSKEIKSENNISIGISLSIW